MAAALETSVELSKPDGLLGVAAEYATDSVPVAQPDQTVGEVRDEMAGAKFRCAEDVVVLEAGRLLGLISIERLLAADPDADVEHVMDADPPKGRSRHRSAERGPTDGGAARVQPGGRGCRRSVRGAVPSVSDARACCSPSTTRTSPASAATSRQHSRPRGRRGTGRATTLASFALAACRPARRDGGGRDRRRFEEQLEAKCCSLFVPAVVYMADAVGTQTETRHDPGLSAGITVRSVLSRELSRVCVMGIVSAGPSCLRADRLGRARTSRWRSRWRCSRAARSRPW